MKAERARMDQAQDSLVSSDGKPLRSDWLFLLFLVACLTGAVYVGVLAYREGAKTEASKRAGEAWLQWFIENGPLRQQDGYAPESCAAQQGSTWGGCQNWLFGPDGPFHEQRDAYKGQPMRVVAGCGGGDRSVVGLLALEKVTALPPGAAIPFVVAPLKPDDSIAERVSLRVVVCNKDTSPIRVGEIEF